MTPLLVTLEADEILQKFSQGVLPASWQWQVSGDALWPFAPAGSQLVLQREPRRGALCCLLDGGELAWRRILDVAPDGRVLVRGDNAPLADGWQDEIIGCVQNAPAWSRLAERAPGAWTELTWRTGLAWARGRSLLHRLAGRLRRGLGHQAPAVFTGRPLGAQDMPAYSDLIKRGYGMTVPAPNPRGSGWGLFAGEDLVGAVWLANLAGVPEIRSLIVDPAWRGLGGGVQLVRWALQDARVRHIGRVRAYVHAKNLPSLATFNAAGFAPTGQWLSEPERPLSASRLAQAELEISLTTGA